MQSVRFLWVLLVLVAGSTFGGSNAVVDDLGTGDPLAGLNLDRAVKLALQGNPPSGVTVRELPGGLNLMTVPARADSRLTRQLKSQAGAAKKLISMTFFISLFEPDFSAGIVDFDAAPITELAYNAGFLLYNTSSEDVTAKSTFKTKGPGPDVSFVGDLTFAADSFSLAWLEHESGWDEGFHAITVKVKGAKPGKLKGNFCPGCDFLNN